MLKNIYGYVTLSKKRRRYSCFGKGEPEMKTVYIYILEGNKYLFAEEQYRKLFLDHLYELKCSDTWLLYAFCFIDPCAMFVIEAENMTQLRERIRLEAERLLGRPDLSVRVRKLSSMDEIAACIRKIHICPVQLGYVKKIADYWWSSYPTYMGKHQWELVECRVLSLYFSEDPRIARRKIEQFHNLKTILL